MHACQKNKQIPLACMRWNNCAWCACMHVAWGRRAGAGCAGERVRDAGVGRGRAALTRVAPACLLACLQYSCVTSTQGGVTSKHLDLPCRCYYNKRIAVQTRTSRSDAFFVGFFATQWVSRKHGIPFLSFPHSAVNTTQTRYLVHRFTIRNQ
jgi:hypothetical protein